VVALICGCDSSLASDEFRGVPRLRLSGRLTGDAPAQAPVSPHLALLWQGLESLEAPRLVGELVRISDLGFPATFAVDLYAEPPAPALSPLGSGVASLGLVVAVDDVNKDGAVAVDGLTSASAPDRLFGVGYQTFLVFARPLLADGGIIENPGEARDGFQYARLLCRDATHGEQLRLFASEPTEVVVTMDRSGLISSDAVLAQCTPR
jgi:hypothetical protein